ncbi:MAG: TolC family protein [Bacteroidaceae bacterium]|nr:TolC family protein [Bacteroidaceae bacterium]
MTERRRWLVAMAAAANVVFMFGQEPLRMTLQEIFATAEKHNASIRSCESAMRLAEEDVAAARAEWLPSLEAKASVSYMGNVSIWNRMLKDRFTAETPHFGNNFALMARQTLYSGGAISSGIRRAKLGSERAVVELVENQQKVRFLLVGHYLQLRNLLNQEEVLRQNIVLTEKLISQTRNRMEQGLVLNNDITRHELQLEQLRMGRIRVQNAQRIINHQLVTAIGTDTMVNILPEEDFRADLCPKGEEAEWQLLATSNSVHLKKALLATRMAMEDVQEERSGRMPKIALVAEDHFDGPVTFEIPTLDKNINYWYVGVCLSYDFSSLWKGSRRLKRARTNVEHNRDMEREAREGVGNAIQAAYTEYITSFAEMNTREKSVELASQNYRIIKNRYEHGLALVTDMTDAANVKLDAELGLVSARINVIYNYYQLKYLSNTL